MTSGPHFLYLKKNEDSRYQDNFNLLNKLKFVKILQYLRQFCICKNGIPHFENLKTGVLDIRCLSWNNAIIVFMKKGRMDRRDIKVVTEFPCEYI